MKEEDANPDQKDQGSDDGDEPVEDHFCAGVDHDEGDAWEQGCDHDCEIRDTATVGSPNPFGSPAVLGKWKHHSSGDIEIRIGRRDNRREDHGVHIIRPALHPSLQKDNRKWRIDDRPPIIHQPLIVIGNNTTQKEDREDIKECDPDEDSINGFGNMFVGVTGFGGGDTREFGTTVGETDGYENGEERFEAALEGCAFHVPVVDTESFAADCSGVGENPCDDEDDDGDNF